MSGGHWIDEQKKELSDRCSQQANELITLRAQRDQARTWAVALEGKGRRMEEALRLIAGDSCENFTTGLGSCGRFGRAIDAPYAADRWCKACIAHAALPEQP